MAEMRVEMKEIKTDVAETRDIVKAFEAVKTGGKFLTWFAAVIAAIGVIILALKSTFSLMWVK